MRVDSTHELIKQAGLMVTPQRVAILEVLMEEGTGHPSPEWVYRQVSERFPHLSLATVYNTLDRFEEVGLIRKVNPLFGVARYDVKSEPHLHAVCTSCGEIRDVPWNEELVVQTAKSGIEAFQVQSVSVHLLGLCDACREREKLKNLGK